MPTQGHRRRTNNRPAMHSSAPTALVWFKRDLRLRDHAPLMEAARFERSLAVAVVEPAWLISEECDAQHVAFWLDAVTALQRDLASLGLPLLVRVGAMTEVLQQLHQDCGFTHLLSHEETGPGWSYERDIAVAGWCRSRGVQWIETPQTGVVRRLATRSGWAARWAQRMNALSAPAPQGFKGAVGWAPAPVPSLRDLQLTPPHRVVPPSGEGAAWAALQSFLADRAHGYRSHLSSPLTAAEGCSRLSAHLAFGTISMRCVHQATEARIQRLASSANNTDRPLAHDLRGFASRLRWHCHFMQKLEDEPALEWRNLARSVDGQRAGDGVNNDAVDQERLQAWCEGRTGYPMVDACMRQLRATGWLNFRMRAMLVSFAAYHLWLHWREPGLFLARQFLDFEPGIHWSQMQMQSGTTGINTLRIYSPGKQAQDHDPQGEYVRRWVPEFGSASYPPPIVDERLAVAAAKSKLYGLRRKAQAQNEADAIQQKHGSRKSGLPSTTRTTTRPHRSRGKRTDTEDSAQGQLF
jgi:deoxyribodipyrimidine photo-lyase